MERAAGWGRPLVLHGARRGSRLVTPLYLIDPAPGTPFFQPNAANRFVAIQVELVNVGTVFYSDTVSNGAQLLDSRGRLVRAHILDAAEPGLNRPRLRVGDRKSGTLSFELPKRVRVRALRLTLDSGFGPDTGLWKLAE